jgi:hypothetical protein
MRNHCYMICNHNSQVPDFKTEYVQFFLKTQTTDPSCSKVSLELSMINDNESLKSNPVISKRLG